MQLDEDTLMQCFLDLQTGHSDKDSEIIILAVMNLLKEEDAGIRTAAFNLIEHCLTSYINSAFVDSFLHKNIIRAIRQSLDQQVIRIFIKLT